MTALTRVETYRRQAQIRTTTKLAHDADARQSGEYRIPCGQPCAVEDPSISKDGPLLKRVSSAVSTSLPLQTPWNSRQIKAYTYSIDLMASQTFRRYSDPGESRRNRKDSI